MGRGIVVLFMLDTSSPGANCVFYVLSNKVDYLTSVDVGTWDSGFMIVVKCVSDTREILVL